MDPQSYVFYRLKCELAIKYEQDIHANSKICDDLDANRLVLIACLKVLGEVGYSSWKKKKTCFRILELHEIRRKLHRNPMIVWKFGGGRWECTY